MIIVKTKKLIAYFLLLAHFFLAPYALALEMPKEPQEWGTVETVGARSFAVADAATGKIIISRNADQLWTPASLTKLVTAMVFLDSKTPLTKSIAMSKADEVGGARLYTKAGVKYRLKDLLYATLIASANNAANALARGTGLTREQFVEKMNEKAKALGAENSIFTEPSGISPLNVTTAEDFVKITIGALSYEEIARAAGIKDYSLSSASHKAYRHKLTSTNKLLGDPGVNMVGGKTGYLEESLYNFSGIIKDIFGNQLVVVVLGSPSSRAQFAETRELAALGSLAKTFLGASAVLGASTTSSTTLISTQ